MLTSLPSVLFRFRERKVCVTADIKEMFHQVKIRPEDRTSQRFLYRSDTTQPPETYIMDVATFGSTCSPCSTQFVKNLNAEQWKEVYPDAAVAIVENHYVDDYLDSRDSEEEVIRLSNDVRIVHSKAGFELRNWRSNSEEVLRRVGAEQTNVAKLLFADKAAPAERVLGMAWLPTEDMFTFSVILSDDLQRMILGMVAVTKRGVLRVLMSLFDPHGLISNFLIHGKIIIQDLWRSGVSWDEAIPRKIQEQWERWINLLQNLSRIRVPRCYFPGYHVEDLKTLELHVFVDASESAYACVGYFRIIDQGKPRCVFVTSKAKVTPLKSVSVPRLELNAGVIGCRLAKTIKEKTTLPITRTVYWTDSSTLLSWIRSDTRKYRQYIAVRVGEILETTDISEWRWVPTKLNVADEATKWGNGPNIDPDSRWFMGPNFLYQMEEFWPQQKLPEPDTTEELRPMYMHREIIRSPFIDVSRFSKWERLIRCTAYVFHWFDRPRTPPCNRSPLLTKEDFKRSEAALWRLAQADGFADAIVELSEHSKDQARRPLRIDKFSKIRHLSPFPDDCGVIRMEGRIEASPFAPYDAKYPVILPRGHYITELLIDWYHRRFGHGFSETVVNEIRQRFHVSNLRVLVRDYPKRCKYCCMEKAEPKIPRMAPLPAARVTPYERAFTSVGIDYCGPFAVKFGRGTMKRWVALFTCLATRAVHLEVVASLSTESCKFAIRRFIGRRGAPAEIYTDNGTNFQGTKRELEEQMRTTNLSLTESFTNTNTRWFFIPPASPHMGGVWERMVRSVKAAMNVLQQSRTPTEEVFLTICTEAESMINSRPLTYIPLETSDQEALTPNHFLLLSSTGVKQTVKHPTTNAAALRNDWSLCQSILDRFWTRWIREYLPTITRRTKWFDDVEPLAVGSLVFIVDDKLRNNWVRGRVLRVIQSSDGRIRQADVQTASGGVLRRAVAKLAVLDIKSSGKAVVPEQHYGSGDVGTGHTANNDLHNEYRDPSVVTDTDVNVAGVEERDDSE